jgi:23S rRNA (uracil1939-C5)-methyltransferase
MGNFSLPLALAAREVVGCDLQGAAIRAAKRNAEQAGLTNCRFLRQPAAAGAREMLSGGERFDLLLLDPPRQGCADLLSLLPELGARRLIYISCDPATLARDLVGLREQGFQLRRLQMVDMFPQTHHLETITLLERG